MAGKPYLPLYVGDWLKDPALSMCVPATRGVWIDMLCRMHEMDSGTITGSWDRVACLLRCTVEELRSAADDLYRSRAADVEIGDTITITCRRMVRDIAKRKACSDAGKRGGGNPALKTYKGRTKGTPKGPYDNDNDNDNESGFALEGESRGGTVEMVPVSEIVARSKDPLSPEAIYSLYPRKVGKAAAVAAIAKAIKIVAGAESMTHQQAAASLRVRTQAFAESTLVRTTDPQYIPHPSTWFNQGRYGDDPREWDRDATKSNGTAHRDVPMTAERLDAILGA